jgi:hypothetical protein
MDCENKNIKICRICNINNAKPKQRRCQKCISKVNNEQLKAKNYYKEYYETNKDEFLQRYREHYKLTHIEPKKRGRPNKIKEDKANIIIQ